MSRQMMATQEDVLETVHLDPTPRFEGRCVEAKTLLTPSQLRQVDDGAQFVMEVAGQKFIASLDTPVHPEARAFTTEIEGQKDAVVALPIVKGG